MTHYFLGADVGSSKTHVLIADEAGRALGFGLSGPGNHETVGYEGLQGALSAATHQALATAGLTRDQLSGAGFGVAGFDWPSEQEATLRAIGTLGLNAPVAAVNDALIGLLAGSEQGWGIALVSGTGCNCRGWDRTRQYTGQVTGGGLRMGEAAGGTELIARAVQAVAYEWTGRGPATQLSHAFIQYTGVRDLLSLLHGLTEGRIELTARAAPIVFDAAAAGDLVANDILRWAGRELGELTNTVIRQLHFEGLAFDVVLVGSMFNGGSLLTDPMRATIHAVAPGARFMPLAAPPVVGAVLLGMEQAGENTMALRSQLTASTQQMLRASPESK